MSDRGGRSIWTVVIVVVAIGVWLTRPAAQRKPSSSSAVEPFQIGLAVVVPPNGDNSVGTTTFTVPAGKLLNLRFLTVIHGITARIEIDTSVAGVTVTHYRLTSPSDFDRPLYLWADDTGGPVTVRVLHPNTSAPVTWNLSLTGDLF